MYFLFHLSLIICQATNQNVAELKPGPPYTCKMLTSSYGKNPAETQNDKYTPKTYTFDVTKFDEIFYRLVADGQVTVPNGL